MCGSILQDEAASRAGERAGDPKLHQWMRIVVKCANRDEGRRPGACLGRGCAFAPSSIVPEPSSTGRAALYQLAGGQP